MQNTSDVSEPTILVKKRDMEDLLHILAVNDNLYATDQTHFENDHTHFKLDYSEELATLRNILERG